LSFVPQLTSCSRIQNILLPLIDFITSFTIQALTK
jgi:hypothetical protein